MKQATYKAFGRRTFRFKFLLIYAAAGFIAVSIILASGLISRSVVSGYQHFDTRIDPLKYQLLSINNNISQLTAYQQAYLQTQDNHFKDKLDFLRNKVKSRLSIVAAHADTLNDPSFIIQVDRLKDTYNNLLADADRYQAAGMGGDQKLQVAFLERMETMAAMAKETNNYVYEAHQRVEYTDVMESITTRQYYLLGGFLVMIIIFYFIVRHARRFINQEVLTLQNELVELSEGNLPQALPNPQNELSPITQYVNVLLENLKSVKEFSLKVGDNDFDTDITVFNNEGELGNALASMRQSLKEVSIEDKQRNWINVGLAQFLNIIRDYNGKTEELSYQVTSNLVKYVGATQGGIFLVQKSGNTTKLVLESCFAYDRKKFTEKELEPGQGLVGQAYLEQEKIYLKEVPEHYTKITSGLGLSTPRTILVQPLKVNDEVMGVLELASFDDFAPHVQEFIEKVSESVASAIGNAQNSIKNDRILTEQRDLTEQLRSQEEELRQNTEELQATTEELERKIRELENENALLKSEVPA
jgi:methyl-accepting chemotaxis protein